MKIRPGDSRQAAAAVLALLLGTQARGQDLASFEKRVTTKVLRNGLTVIVCERPEAPVFSYTTAVDVGAAQEVPGITGLAHMFEHMAFKGTESIGTTDAAAEKAALAKVEEAYAAYDHERRREVGRDEARVKTLEKAWQDAVADADRYVIPNQFSEILERRGAEGLNAHTASDSTWYEFSLPSNRLELLASLESERFLNPVLREFYKERDVVMEERRMRTDSSPIGRLVEQFVAAAFTAHPYGQPVIGWPSDLQSFSATDARAFYERYYVPANMVFAVVGDVKAAQALPLLAPYFERLPERPRPEPLRTIEPPQRGERRVVLREAAQPYYLEGYHRPSLRDPDDAVYEVISELLSEGRTSRLYRALVRDKAIAAEASGFNNFPDAKYPHLFVFYGVSTPGHTPAELGEAIHVEIERLQREDVSRAELETVKTRARAALLRSLGSNEGLAAQLAAAQLQRGDWREVFRQVDRIQKVTAADVRRVATRTFVAENRTVGMLETVPAGGGAQ
jgi:predicted Zn-dependent peptidase